MSTLANPAPQAQSDWASFYEQFQASANVPDVTQAQITAQRAVFRGMYLDLGQVAAQVRASGVQPLVTQVYADVLNIPPNASWALAGTGLQIIARHIQVAQGYTVYLDYRHGSDARLVVFANEWDAPLSVVAVTAADQPTQFSLDATNAAPGASVGLDASGAPACTTLAFAQGVPFSGDGDMHIYLANSQIAAELMSDRYPSRAMAILRWVAAWAAVLPDAADMFFSATSLATLLASDANAKANGARYVPYLSAQVYTSLAGAFASQAAAYETNYQTLSVQTALTEQNITMAATMAANAMSDTDYVKALLQQSQQNCLGAQAAVTKAQSDFLAQKIATDAAQANFQQVGIPAYERKQAVEAAGKVVGALVTFGGAIAAMAVGDEAAAPAAAQSAIQGAEAVATAAQTGAQVAKTASDLASTMKQLKQVVEGLKAAYDLSSSLVAVVQDVQHAQQRVASVAALSPPSPGVDLSAADQWSIFQLDAGAALAGAIGDGIDGAQDYKDALDKLAVYGQALAGAQLAAIRTDQHYAALSFRLNAATQRQANLTAAVAALKAGQAPALAMLQQFYRKALDARSYLFAALRSYQDSYFYWALGPSSVNASMVDSPAALGKAIGSITAISLDHANALEHFDPAPQTMTSQCCVVTDAAVLAALCGTGKATVALPLDTPAFAGMARVRLSTVRVWLDGVRFATPQPGSVFVSIATGGNYLDRLGGADYQFNSRRLQRSFKYQVQKPGSANPDWTFEDGSTATIQIDGAVDREVDYAYFEPTPFSAWTISLDPQTNAGVDWSGVSQITFEFAGSTIGQA